MKNQISKLLIFLSKLAKTVRIFLASIQLAVYKISPASENLPLGEKQQKSCRNPRNNGLQQLYGTLERTLTSDLPLRRRLLYTTELLGHMNFGVYDYEKKDLNELPLRRRTLYPGELRRHSPCILPKLIGDVKKKMGKRRLFQFSSLQTALFPL